MSEPEDLRLSIGFVIVVPEPTPCLGTKWWAKSSPKKVTPSVASPLMTPMWYDILNDKTARKPYIAITVLSIFWSIEVSDLDMAYKMVEFLFEIDLSCDVKCVLKS
jgi:hypothetical protein